MLLLLGWSLIGLRIYGCSYMKCPALIGYCLSSSWLTWFDVAWSPPRKLNFQHNYACWEMDLHYCHLIVNLGSTVLSTSHYILPIADTVGMQSQLYVSKLHACMWSTIKNYSAEVNKYQKTDHVNFSARQAKHGRFYYLFIFFGGGCPNTNKHAFIYLFFGGCPNTNKHAVRPRTLAHAY